MNKEMKLEKQLQILFLQLRLVSKTPIEDDTILQKLYSALDGLLDDKKCSSVWCTQVGMIPFICDSLGPTYIKDENNYPIVTFSLQCLSSIVVNEDRFVSLIQNEVIYNFKFLLPNVQDNMSLLFNSLKVAEALITHNTGLQWFIENDIWENLLIRSLKLQNLFIRKSCTNVITKVILLVKDTEKFSSYIRDLELVLYKVREKKLKFYQYCDDNCSSDDYEIACAVSKLQFNTQTMLYVFHNLLLESLGKVSLHSQLKALFDLSSKILFRLNFAINPGGVFRLSKILILNSIHRFQDQILEFGTSEQFHLDSFTSDILSLTRHMINKGFYQEFMIASFEIHKYWDIMCRNIRKTRDAELSKCEAVLPLILKIQFAPLRVICNNSLDMGTEEDRKSFEENRKLWRKSVEKNMAIREEHKNELDRLYGLLKDKYSDDMNRANEQSISHLVHVTSVLDHFHPFSASYLVQILIFVLKFKIEATSNLESNPKLYFYASEILRTLIEKFEIDWKNCYESKSFFPSLCSIVWMPGLTSRVKVSVIQTLTTCISKFIPPLTANLDNFTNIGLVDEGYLTKLGETIGIYLADTEWEVRDSAFELILQCMKVETQKHTSFSDWFLKFNFLDLVLQAIGDIEPYVQASAIEVLTTVISIEEVWVKVKPEDIKQKALRAIVRSGESPIRISGIQLLQALVINRKFTPEEIEKYVIPIVQSASQDSNDEIRLAAIKFIQQHFDIELLSLGMVDGAFPKVTFQYGKITNLEDEEVANRVFGVISSFCQNGYFRCIFNCYSDVKTISDESSRFLNLIISLVEKYNLHNKLLSDRIENEIADCSTGLYSTCEDSDIGNEVIKKQKTDEECIEYVLGTSDISVISKLRNESSFTLGQFWWNGKISEPLLNESEIPKNIESISGIDVLKLLEKIQTGLNISQNPEINYEEEIAQLLEDILLVTKHNEENEARAMDCY